LDTNTLLEVRDLKTHFFLDMEVVKAVDGVDFEVSRGRTLGIVGESGCGKSVTAQSVMQIVPSPPGRIVGGTMTYYRDGEPVEIGKLPANSQAMRDIRGKEISYIFQEPMTSLSPVHTIGNQLEEAVLLHTPVSRTEARQIAIDALVRVRIPEPARVIDEYVHQLSGGMRQRVVIAQALSCNPRLLIADEPTTALDVTMQAQVLRTIQDIQQESGMGLILITHDMGVIGQMADEVAVIYRGRVVERGDVMSVFDEPKHPYTKALFDSIPRLDTDKPLKPITGSVPDPFLETKGCPFRDRCPSRFAACESDAIPALVEVAPGHSARCYLHSDQTERGVLEGVEA